MDYRIENKEAFTVIANAKTFPYEGAKANIPAFWQEHFRSGKGRLWVYTASTLMKRWATTPLST